MIAADKIRDRARALYDDYHIECVGRFGEFEYPIGMDIDKDGTVLVTDYHPGTISRFGCDGNLLGVLDPPVKALSRIVADCDSQRLFVVERDTNSVVMLNYEGDIEGKLSHLDGRVFQFDTPVGIKFDNDNNVMVADMFRHTLDMFGFSGVHIVSVSLPPKYDLPFAIEFDDTNACHFTRYNYELSQDSIRNSLSYENEHSLIKICGTGSFESYALPYNRQYYFSDLAFFKGCFYLVDGRRLYKYNRSFSLVYKLDLTELIPGLDSGRLNNHIVIRGFSGAAGTFLYLLESVQTGMVYKIQIG